MDIGLFDYELPQDRIAQAPVEPRDSSKLLLCRAQGRLGEWTSEFQYEHRAFKTVSGLLGPGDWLVTNDAKVLPVRILGKRAVESSEAAPGGAVEALLLKRLDENEWTALLHLSARVRPGLRFIFEPGVVAEVLSTHEERLAHEGEVRLRFSGLALERKPLEAWLERHGHVPLPPYIERSDAEVDKTTYQTVYARAPGSAAAPTAGFHFTPGLLQDLEARGVERHAITLHVGLGTFRPIKGETLDGHVMHEEIFEISPEFAAVYRQRKAAGKRLVAVGTTVVRALESWAVQCAERGIVPGSAESAGRFSTRLFISPGYRFQAVDDLITNFHLPRSTLLVLVGAAMGVGPMREAYSRALGGGYRFFSYGDAMMIRGGSV